jgi:hypothetical protein
MALSDKEIQECLREVGAFIAKRRPPEHIRAQLDYRGEVQRSEVVLSSVRPALLGRKETMVQPFAKIKWIGTKSAWIIYWMRADLKWHRYDPSQKIRSLHDALAEIHADPYGCFFG